MPGVDYHRALMGRCSCNNLPRCAAIQKQLLDADENYLKAALRLNAVIVLKSLHLGRNVLYTWD